MALHTKKQHIISNIICIFDTKSPNKVSKGFYDNININPFTPGVNMETSTVVLTFEKVNLLMHFQRVSKHLMVSITNSKIF